MSGTEAKQNRKGAQKRQDLNDGASEVMSAKYAGMLTSQRSKAEPCQSRAMHHYDFGGVENDNNSRIPRLRMPQCSRLGHALRRSLLPS